MARTRSCWSHDRARPFASLKTRCGRWDCRPRGVLAVKLGTDDAVVGMGVIQKDTQVVILTEQGYAKRTAAEGFPSQKRYGGGVQAAKLSSQTGPVAVATLAAENQSLVLMTAKGQVTQIPVKAIQATGRTAVGHKSRKDTQEPYIEPATHGPPALLTALAGTKAAARRVHAKATASKTEGTRSEKPKASK